MSTVISFRIDKKMKEEMDKLKHVDWNAVVKEAIARKIAEEKKLTRRKDLDRISKASHTAERLLRRVEGWSAVAEIRRWREAR